MQIVCRPSLGMNTASTAARFLRDFSSCAGPPTVIHHSPLHPHYAPREHGLKGARYKSSTSTHPPLRYHRHYATPPPRLGGLLGSPWLPPRNACGKRHCPFP